MHDMHEPNCNLCVKFVLPFDKDGPLSDWGYCGLETVDHEPTPETLKETDTQAKEGDYSFLSDKNIPIYQALEEGCDKFQLFADHHH